MNFFYTLNGRKLKQLLIIVVAALFSAGILYVEQDQLAVFSTKDGPRAIDKVNTKEKKIALTFDISWGETKAMPILEILKKHHLNKTTFFLSGSWVEKHPDIAKRIAEDGHEIGLHGYRYQNYTEWEDAKVQQDIYLAQDALKDITKENSKLLRPPNGSFNKRVLTISEKLGYTIVHWSIDSEDWKNPGTNQIIKNVTENVKGGDIVLLHASDSAKQTEKALPVIIDDLKKRGFSFVTVSELIADTNTKSKEIN
ncbi:polysaccharide deacetylase family sporulation protein PdaB [Bacillus taeanensis]|uniref:Polysaccharide deacetylase family sporulation protein PdaB n=1 Tax=Bacillus taeanensis TaxID=273032 RepID=A0A366XPZ6_9BACI|nr:polysaccharide deacetylase family sporulation protein PdaB [Bacillus taeanensis]RBW67796.1 polysaccharide deacetylase family sporulation protein PdaB [Bacillus taeanensis]